MLNWKWVNRSDPKVPNRRITWQWEIPYIIYVSGSLFWEGFSFGITTPLGGLDYITNVSCGRSVEWGFRKWFFYFVFNWGYSAGIYIGFSRLQYIMRSLRVSMKKDKRIK